MASRALKLRAKAEAAELGQQAGIAVPAKKEQPEDRAPPSAVRMMPSEDNLLAIPASKAVLAHFPPGCPVLHINTSVVPVTVSKGTVEAVFVDLTPGAYLHYFYRISLGYEGKTIISGESQLQWAPQCPVWVHLIQETTGSAWKRARVSGSYQDNGPDADPKYSVQEVGPGTALFHGVLKDYIRFRPDDDGRSSESPTSVTESAPLCSIENHGHHRQPAPPVQTPTHERPDKAVSCVTASPQTCPVQSKESLVDNPVMGCCSAEFALPMWLKTPCLASSTYGKIVQV